MTGKAYPEAWAYLQSIFHNPKTIVRTLFLKLRNLEPIRIKK